MRSEPRCGVQDSLLDNRPCLTEFPYRAARHDWDLRSKMEWAGRSSRFSHSVTLKLDTCEPIWVRWCWSLRTCFVRELMMCNACSRLHQPLLMKFHLLCKSRTRTVYARKLHVWSGPGSWSGSTSRASLVVKGKLSRHLKAPPHLQNSSITIHAGELTLFIESGKHYTRSCTINSACERLSIFKYGS